MYDERFPFIQVFMCTEKRYVMKQTHIFMLNLIIEIGEIDLDKFHVILDNSYLISQR